MNEEATYPVWMNFRTGEYEDGPLTAENAKDFISQDSISQNLFKCYLATGDDYLTALIKVLKISTGSKSED